MRCTAPTDTSRALFRPLRPRAPNWVELFEFAREGQRRSRVESAPQPWLIAPVSFPAAHMTRVQVCWVWELEQENQTARARARFERSLDRQRWHHREAHRESGQHLLPMR